MYPISSSNWFWSFSNNRVIFLRRRSAARFGGWIIEVRTEKEETRKRLSSVSHWCGKRGPGPAETTLFSEELCKRLHGSLAGDVPLMFSCEPKLTGGDPSFLLIKRVWPQHCWGRTQSYNLTPPQRLFLPYKRKHRGFSWAAVMDYSRDVRAWSHDVDVVTESSALSWRQNTLQVGAWLMKACQKEEKHPQYSKLF